MLKTIASDDMENLKPKLMRTTSRGSNPLVKRALNLEVGQAVEVEIADWKNKYKATSPMDAIKNSKDIKESGFKFESYKDTAKQYIYIRRVS